MCVMYGTAWVERVEMLGMRDTHPSGGPQLVVQELNHKVDCLAGFPFLLLCGAYAAWQRIELPDVVPFEGDSCRVAVRLPQR